MEGADELNTILRSLLISNPRKTKVSYLKKDFRENYGKEFPFHQFGFKTFLDYLCSIPDVVQVVDKKTFDPVVLPVATEKSAHVESLIMRQRVDNKTCQSRRSPPSRRPTAIHNENFQQEIPSLLSLPFLPLPDFKINTTQKIHEPPLRRQPLLPPSNLKINVVDGNSFDPVVLPITTEKSSHVESLIMRQKIDNKKNRSGRGPPPRRPPAMKSVPSKYYENQTPQERIPSLLPTSNFQKQYPSRANHTNTEFQLNEYLYSDNNYNNHTTPNYNHTTSSYDHTAPNDNYTASSSENPVLPEFVCQKVKQLLSDNPSGITFLELTREIFMKDMSTLARYNVTNTKELVEKCKDFVTVDGNVVYLKSVERLRAPDRNYGNIYPAGFEEEFDRDDNLSPNLEFCDTSTDTVQNGMRQYYYTENDRNCHSSLHDSKDYSDVVDDEEELGVKITNNFRKLLEIYTDGIWCAQLPEFYFKEFHVPLDVQEWNYSSVIQMASRLPNIFHYVREEGSCSDWKLYDARVKSRFDTDSGKKAKSNLLSRKWIPQSVLGNIQKLVAEYPTGIPITFFLEKYKERFNPSISDLGFDSVQSFLDAIENVVRIREAYNTIFLLPKKVKPVEDELPLPTVPALPELQVLIPTLYPKEVCGPDFVLPFYPLKEKVPYILQVRVTEVCHPGCFWLVAESSWDELEDMMTDINDFYKCHYKNNERYLMPESTMFRGQLCAAPYGVENKWHRAKILHYFSFEDKVKIEYIDYGTINIIPKSLLRFLHKDFCEMPQLAIKGKLYGIECVGPKWTKDSGREFYDHINERSLLAEVCVCKPEENYIEIVLYEAGPDGARSGVINNYFVKRGDARYIEKNKKEANTIDSSKSPTEVKPIEFNERVPRLTNSNVTSTYTNIESYCEPPSVSEMNNTLCMNPLRRPPPGFTEKDVDLRNSCHYLDNSCTSVPPFNSKVEEMFANNDTNNVCNLFVDPLNTGLQFGQHLQPPQSINYNSMPTSNVYYPSYPYQVTINNTYQPSPNTNQLLQLLSSLVDYQRFSCANTNVTQTAEAALKPNVSITQNVPVIPEPLLHSNPETTSYNYAASESGSEQSFAKQNDFESLQMPVGEPKYLYENQLSGIQEVIKSRDAIETPESVFVYGNEGDSNPVEDVEREQDERSYLNHQGLPGLIGGYKDVELEVVTSSSVPEETQVCDDSKPKQVKGIWSPVEINKKIIEMNNPTVEGNAKKRSDSQSSRQNCKTPESWEDYLIEAYNDRFKLIEQTENTQVTLSPEKSSKTNPNLKKDDNFVIPPIANKQLCRNDEGGIRLRNIKIDDVPEKKKCVLKKIEVGPETIHIMKVNGDTTVSSEEIRQKFTKFSSHKVIIKILVSKQIRFPFTDLSRDKHPTLFDEIEKTELFALNAKAGTLAKMNVLPLDVVPLLLNVLNFKKPEVIADLIKAAGFFSDDEHW